MVVSTASFSAGSAITGAHAIRGQLVGIRRGCRDEAADEWVDPLFERRELRLEQRRQVEGLLGELDDPDLAGLVQSGGLQPGGLEGRTVGGVQAEIAMVALAGRVYLVDAARLRSFA